MPAAIAPEIDLLTELLRCKSITPDEAGAIDLIENRLGDAGFTCTRLPFGEGAARVDNLFAIWGEGARHLGFNGHIDVVPPGDVDAWSHDPFGGEVDSEGRVHGRGAVDMKGGVAAFITAAIEHIKEGGDPDTSRISIMITADEEGNAVNGSAPLVEWVVRNNLLAGAYIVGEPSNPEHVGDAIKYGRRGALSAVLTVHGSQGHSANPHFADNPIPRLMDMLEIMRKVDIDKGNDYFGPSTAVITGIDTGNPTHNVIPNQVTARFNIRFNSDYSADDMKKKITDHFDSVGGKYDIEWIFNNASPFITEPGPFTDMLADSVEEATGRRPAFSTTGGTSDARFIAPHAPVAEFGLVGKTMHKVDEFTTVSDMALLKKSYRAMIRNYLESTTQSASESIGG